MGGIVGKRRGRPPKNPAVVERLSRSEILEPYRAHRIAKDGRIVEVALTATELVNEAGKVYAIATTERQVKAEAHV